MSLYPLSKRHPYLVAGFGPRLSTTVGPCLHNPAPGVYTNGPQMRPKTRPNKRWKAKSGLLRGFGEVPYVPGGPQSVTDPARGPSDTVRDHDGQFRAVCVPFCPVAAPFQGGVHPLGVPLFCGREGPPPRGSRLEIGSWECHHWGNPEPDSGVSAKAKAKAKAKTKTRLWHACWLACRCSFMIWG